MMELSIDSRERKRADKAKEYFIDNEELKENYTVNINELYTGDFVFNNKVCFEYKTQSDFISSIVDGRVFNEAIKQSETYPYHFVIIQGTNRDRKRALEYAGSFTLKQYYGAIARLNTYTTVINCTGLTEDAFYQMHVQAKKCLDDKNIKIKHFDVKSGNPAFNALCYCLDDIADERAKSIVNHLGLKTWSDVYHLTRQDLLKVPGIGKVLSESIICQINEMG